MPGSTVTTLPTSRMLLDSGAAAAPRGPQADAVAEAVAELLAEPRVAITVARERVDSAPIAPGRIASSAASWASRHDVVARASSSGSSPVANVRVQSEQ